MTRRNGTPNSAGCFFSRRWRGDLFNGLEGNVGIGCIELDWTVLWSSHGAEPRRKAWARAIMKYRSWLVFSSDPRFRLLTDRGRKFQKVKVPLKDSHNNKTTTTTVSKKEISRENDGPVKIYSNCPCAILAPVAQRHPPPHLAPARVQDQSPQ